MEKATKQRRSSERFRRKVVARWRWLEARGVELVEAAREIGVTAGELRAWSQGQVDEARLIVPVQVEIEDADADAERRGIVVVLGGGVRVEGLTVADVAELARRLS